MVFRKPGNSRDDKPAQSSKRNSKSGDQRRSNSSGYKSSAPKSNDKNDKPFSRERKPFGASGDRFGKPAGDRNRRPTDRPYGERAERGSDKPYGERNERRNDKPYGERAERGPNKPYGERNERRSDKPYGERTERSADKPQGERSERRSDKPFGERKFGGKPGFGKSESGEKRYGGRSSEGKFEKRGGDRPFKKPFDKSDKPFRSRENDNTDAEKPQRVMRGRKAAADTTAEAADDGLIRLNRYISNAGICSRRKADELIEAGVISVNGEVISELGFKIDPYKDVIRYNGETLKREKMVYVLLNKPKDYITTTDDPMERRTVMHLVDKATKERIYPVGRLDRNTTGLLLMTNDGDLADKLSHPKNNISKLYHVELDKNLTQGDLNKLGFGIELEDGFIKPDMVSYVQGGTKREIGIQIHSGRNRIVRRIFEQLGYEVVKLDRSVYANLTKKDLPRGRWRYLDEKEVIQLKHLVK